MIPSNPPPGGVKDGLNCRGLGQRENLPVGGRLKYFLEALVTLIQELEAKQCITRMAPGEEGFFSRVFLVPKKSGGYRLVIDLSQRTSR